jgi:hypothetical protein
MGILELVHVSPNTEICLIIKFAFSWETWKTTEWTEEDEKKSGVAGTRSRSSRIKKPKSGDDTGEHPSIIATANASANSGADTESGASGASKTNGKDNDDPKKGRDNDPNGTPHQVVNNNNINVHAKGGEGGHASVTLPNQVSI